MRRLTLPGKINSSVIEANGSETLAESQFLW